MRDLNEITVELLQKCNSNCIFCSSLSSNASQHQIPLEKVKQIIDFCSTKKATTISFSGGEPLLYTDLTKVLTYTLDKGLFPTIYTSANIATYANVFNELQSFDKTKLKFVINYPSSDNEIYQKIINSKACSVDKVNNFIQELVKEGFLVEVHIVPNGINIKTLYSTAQFLKQIGIKKISFLKLVMQGRASSNKDILQVDFSTLNTILTKIVNELEDSEFKIRLGVPLSNIGSDKCECFAGISKLIFRYDGVVFPCEAFKEAPNNFEYILGSIYENSLDEIWENHPVHEKLKDLKIEATKKAEPCPAQVLYYQDI